MSRRAIQQHHGDDNSHCALPQVAWSELALGGAGVDEQRGFRKLVGQDELGAQDGYLRRQQAQAPVQKVVARQALERDAAVQPWQGGQACDVERGGEQGCQVGDGCRVLEHEAVVEAQALQDNVLGSVQGLGSGLHGQAKQAVQSVLRLRHSQCLVQHSQPVAVCDAHEQLLFGQCHQRLYPSQA